MKKPKPIDLFKEIPLSEKESKRKKSPNTDISKKFITDYYKKRYLELFSAPPKIVWGKDLKLLNTIIKTYPDVAIFGCENHLIFLIKACEKYFVSKDSLALKNAWSIGIFFNNIDKIVLSLKNVEDDVVSQIIEGYKLAYLNHSGNKLTDSLIGEEEIFAQLYLIIKPFWVKYGKDFSLKIFSEIYFLMIMGYNKNKPFTPETFISKFVQDKFQNWLETEGKEELIFFPKGVGNKTKAFLKQQENLQKEEEYKLLHK